MLSRVLNNWRHSAGQRRPKPIDRATEEDLRYCYRLLLNREPDRDGWEHFSNLIKHDQITVQYLVTTFLDSPEFQDVQARFSELTLVELPRYQLYVRLNDFFIGAAIAREHAYEPGVTREIENFLFPGATFVDVGANIGFFTLLGAALVGPWGHVIAFEPNPENCQLLQRSLDKNQFHNVQVFQNALAETAQKLNFFGGTINSNGCLIHESERAESPRIIQVEAVTLDQALPTLPRLDLIKMDIEGAEPRAWQGMSKTIQSYRPVIILEFSPTAIRKTSQKSPEAFLDALQEKYWLHILPDVGGKSKQPQNTDEIMAYVNSQADHANLIAFPR
jgi:FkbM family methyltransferase